MVDYVTSRTDTLRRIITSLTNRRHSDPLDAPVRLLLLERRKDATWWDKLITSDHTGYAIEQDQFLAEPLDVGPMTEDDLWQSMLEILRSAGKAAPDRVETLATLARIDPERRPLFAAFAADALVHGGNIRGWDRDRLLRDVMKRERDLHWNPAGVTEPYENLLCLGTMVGGLSVHHLDEPPSGIELPSREDFDLARYGAMTGVHTTIVGNGAADILPALEPDILGEFFVLEYLRPPHGATNQPAELYRHAAWNIDIRALFGFFAFLNRVTLDFPDHDCSSLLLTPPTAQPLQRYLWARLAVNLTFHYGNAGQLEEAARYLSLLRALEKEHPDELVVRLHLAQSAFNLLSAYGGAHRLPEAVQCHRLLRRLKRTHPDDFGVRFCFAQGAVNLIAFSGNAGRLRMAAVYLNALRQLEDEHSDEPTVRLELARGAFNMLTAYSDHGRLDDAANSLELLHHLARAHSDEKKLSLELARAAVNLIPDYGSAGRWEDTVRCFELLGYLERQHRSEAMFRVRLSQGAFNLIKVCERAGRWDKATEGLEVLLWLANQRPSDPEILVCLTNGALNLIRALHRCLATGRGVLACTSAAGGSHPKRIPSAT